MALKDPMVGVGGVAALGELKGDIFVIGDPYPEIVIEGEEHRLIVGEDIVNFVKSGWETDEKDTFLVGGCAGGYTREEGRNCRV